MVRMALLAGVVLATAVTSTASWAHGYTYRPYWGGYYGPRVGVTFGSPWYWGATWSPWYWGGPWGGYAYPYAYGYPAWRYPPIEYFDTPGPYVERAAGGSWYYCSDPPGYFPHVSLCRRPWIAVAPFAVQGGAAKPQALR